MGGSGRWLKSLISLKKPHTNEQEKVGEKSKKKWRLWRSSSEGYGSSMKKGHCGASEKSESSYVADKAFTAAIATVVRAPPKDFMAIKQEWAAICIQSVFRAFLARRALRALRAVVKLQAIFRGRQVRKQAAVTLRCMQALVRVQACVRARNVRMSPEGKAVRQLLDARQNQVDPVKQAEQGWCDIPGTVDEVKAKLQMRQEAAIKRDRAMAYSLSQQQSRLCASPKAKANRPLSPLKNHSLENKSLGCSLLERWMAAKPWGNRLMEENYFDPPNITPMSKKSEGLIVPFNSYQEYGLIKTRNGMTTRISAKSLATTFQSTSSSSAISSECMNDDSPISTSCTSGSLSLPSTNTLVADSTEEKNACAPSYMNMTESTKAKQNRCSFQNGKRMLMDDGLSYSTNSVFLNGDTRITSGSVPSVNLRKDFCATPQRQIYQKIYHGR